MQSRPPVAGVGGKTRKVKQAKASTSEATQPTTSARLRLDSMRENFLADQRLGPDRCFSLRPRSDEDPFCLPACWARRLSRANSASTPFLLPDCALALGFGSVMLRKEKATLARAADVVVPLQNRQRLVCASYHGSVCQRCCFPNVVKRGFLQLKIGSAGLWVRCCVGKRLPVLLYLYAPVYRAGMAPHAAYNAGRSPSAFVINPGK